MSAGGHYDVTTRPFELHVLREMAVFAAALAVKAHGDAFMSATGDSYRQAHALRDMSDKLGAFADFLGAVHNIVVDLMKIGDAFDEHGISITPGTREFVLQDLLENPSLDPRNNPGWARHLLAQAQVAADDFPDFVATVRQEFGDAKFTPASAAQSHPDPPTAGPTINVPGPKGILQ